MGLNLIETSGVITTLELTLLDQGDALFMKKNEFESEV